MSEINDIKELPEGKFTIKLKFIQKYQQAEPSIIDKYKDGTYHKDYLCGGSNIDLNLITCKDNIFIPSTLRSYVLHWCQTHLLHPRMNRTEATIRRHFYQPDIRDAVRKEVSNCDTCQRKIRPNKKYGKLPAKLSEEIPWNKLCVDLMGPYVIHRKGKK